MLSLCSIRVIYCHAVWCRIDFFFFFSGGGVGEFVDIYSFVKYHSVKSLFIVSKTEERIFRFFN